LPQDVGGARREELEKLRGLSGVAFADAYLQSQIDAHRKVLDLYRSEAEKGRTEAIRAYARNTVPTLEEHLKMALDLRQRLAASRAQGASGSSGRAEK